MKSPNGCLHCGLCERFGVKRADGTIMLTQASAAICPRNLVRLSGEDYTPEELCAKLMKNAEILKSMGGGVTFSGGDPLYPANREQVGALAREVHARFPEKTIWLYTGYRWEQIADLPFLDAIDVIVDGPFIESQKNTQLCWRGSANQRVIDVRRTRETGTVCLHENTDK